MMKLTPDNVEQVFVWCLGEDDERAVRVQGPVHKAVFAPGAIEAHRQDISDMLAELPDTFRQSGGGGWSFLNACDDRHGNQWTGLHLRMEQLFMLGMAAGLAEELMPELRDIMPGGMPYYRVNL